MYVYITYIYIAYKDIKIVLQKYLNFLPKLQMTHNTRHNIIQKQIIVLNNQFIITIDPISILVLNLLVNKH